MDSKVGVEAANNNQRIQFVTFNSASQGVELLNFGDIAPRAEFRATLERPAFNVSPGQFFDRVIGQTLPRAFDSQHRPTASDA